MKKKIALSTLIAMLMFAISGCNDSTDGKNDGQEVTRETGEKATVPEELTFPNKEDEIFSDKDSVTDYEEDKSIRIELDGDTVKCDSKSVSVKDNKVCLLNEATYIISGTMNDGMIIVDSKDTAEVHIVMDGVSVTSSTSAPLYVVNADKVYVTLAEGSENVLVNGGSFEAIDDNNIDGAVFSKEDITFNGEGTLKVTSPAAHGIVSKKDIVFTGGTYDVSSASHAIVADDAVKISGGTYSLLAGKDGIHSENTEDTTKGYVYISDGNFDIESEGDGISGVAYLQIKAGDYNITCGGGSENGDKTSSGGYGDFMGGKPMGPGGHGGMKPRDNSELTTTAAEDSTSMKALKADGNIQISGGTYKINSADDGIHSNLSVEIISGTYEIATGDDGIHADEDLMIKGGTINITECYEGLEGTDISISGGSITLVAKDDGINSAGGNDDSGLGGRDDMNFGKPGGHGGGMMSAGNGTIVISGGTLRITSSGDGIDANGSFEMTGGDVIITGPTVGDTATLDYDTTAVISGGTFIGTGASGMAQTFSESKQGLISIKVGNCTAGTTIIVKDKDGNEIINHSPELNFAVVIVSSPKMEKGQSYTVSVGEDSESIEAN